MGSRGLKLHHTRDWLEVGHPAVRRLMEWCGGPRPAVPPPHCGRRRACGHSAAGGATMPSHASVARLDYVFVGDGPAIAGARLLGERPGAMGFYPSDHLALAATLRGWAE
jgi:endonuclease/exonuclease/phosphatase family metal-dependent hydrolase